MVNLEWYRTFTAVYKQGTLTGAAQQLFISQPGVSLHLSSLEAYVGYKLFERTSRRMLPTERGKILFHAVSESIAALEQAERTFQRSTEKATPTISIGMCFETFQITLEQYIATLPFNVIIRFGDYHEMLDHVEKGIIDLIITPQRAQSQEVVYEAFSSETIVLVGGSNTNASPFTSALLDRDLDAAQQWLNSQKWFGTTGDMEHLFRFWQLNFGHTPEFRPNYIVPNLNSIIRCLSSSDGLAVIPDFLCKAELDAGQLQLIWAGDEPLRNTLYFGNRKNTLYAAELLVIKDLFKRVMGNPES